MQETPEDNERFEKVLNRLDALMKHSQVVSGTPGGEDAAAASAAQAEPEPLAEQAAVKSTPQATESSQQDDTIPVLTEVYEAEVALPAPQAVSASEDEEKTEALLAALMPRLQALTQTLVGEELEKAQHALLARLHGETAAALRQHLRGSTSI